VSLLRIPYGDLYPLIIMFCIVGVYEVNHSIIDRLDHADHGRARYALRKFEFDRRRWCLAWSLRDLGAEPAPIADQSNGNYLIFSATDLARPADRVRGPAGAIGARFVLNKRTGAPSWPRRKPRRKSLAAHEAAHFCTAVSAPQGWDRTVEVEFFGEPSISGRYRPCRPARCAGIAARTICIFLKNSDGLAETRPRLVHWLET